MKIRQAGAADYTAIDNVLRSAFGQSAEAELVRALRASGDAVLELVAEAEGAAAGSTAVDSTAVNSTVCGQVMLSRLQAPRGCLALAPVAVMPGRQGEGLGSALIREALTWAGQGEWMAAFLLGEPAYYTRFGFSVEQAARFETEYPPQYFMVQALGGQSLGILPPQVVYAAPFQALG